MAALDLAGWATIVGTWALVVGTLSFAYWQLRQAQRLHSATTLLELRERFYNPRMRRARREFSGWLLNKSRDDDSSNWEVGVFFEQMGFLTRSGVLDRRMVWNAFGTWVSAYYYFLTHPKDLITEWREEGKDPLIFREFEWLARTLMSHEARLLERAGGSGYAERDARYTMETEARLALEADGPGG